MPIRSFRDLRSWRESNGLAVFEYKITAGFPIEERFGLANQLRRAAVSVPSNIAEGSSRRTTADLLNFLGIARGSVYEILSQCQLALELGYIDSRAALDLDRRYNTLAAGINKSISVLSNARARTNR